jgi:hypothetical protein
LQTNGLGFGPDDNGITWINVKIDDGREGWVSAEFVSTQVPSVAPAAPPANVSDIAAELLRRTNALRQQNGLHPLVLNNDLTQLALTHSEYMSQNGITHIGAGGRRQAASQCRLRSRARPKTFMAGKPSMMPGTSGQPILII